MTDNKKWREFKLCQVSWAPEGRLVALEPTDLVPTRFTSTVIPVIEHKAYQDLKERVDRLAEAIEKSFNDHDDEEMYHTLDKALKEYRGEK